MLTGGGTLVALFFIQELPYFAGLMRISNLRKRSWGYILLGINFLVTLTILSIYKVKSPWYGPTFAPPDDYIQGPLSNDQGNTV